MLLFRQVTFYFALAGFAGVFLLVRQMQQKPPSPPPTVEPARSPYAASVAATGILEAARENVKIAAPKPALIQQVTVQVGSFQYLHSHHMRLDLPLSTCWILAWSCTSRVCAASLTPVVIQRAASVSVSCGW